jgi:hypothetical protein
MYESVRRERDVTNISDVVVRNFGKMEGLAISVRRAEVFFHGRAHEAVA